MRLKAPCYIALASLKDFVRLVCALERTPLPAFSLVFNKEKVLAVQTDIIDGRPVIYYAKRGDAKNGQYLAYRVSGGIEEAQLADSVHDPTFIYSPILNVDRFPRSLARSARVDKRSGYTVIKLQDLSSLAKVAAYKTVFDEPPLPLIMFKGRGKVVLGAPLSTNENDSVSYFYYVSLNEEPREPFLRYASQRSEQPSFSSRLDEHGYIYLKIIRLAADHPLVKTYE